LVIVDLAWRQMSQSEINDQRSTTIQ